MNICNVLFESCYSFGCYEPIIYFESTNPHISENGEPSKNFLTKDKFLKTIIIMGWVNLNNSCTRKIFQRHIIIIMRATEESYFQDILNI